MYLFTFRGVSKLTIIFSTLYFVTCDTRWMQYGNIDKNYMAHREFSFTLEDDIYLRYLSFSNQEEFETEMIKKCPHKIDIGAVYNARPSDHKKLTNFTPQERELGDSIRLFRDFQ